MNVLGLDSYCGCAGSLGDFESLGPPQARSTYLNVCCLWGRRSHEEKANLEARSLGNFRLLSNTSTFPLEGLNPSLSPLVPHVPSGHAKTHKKLYGSDQTDSVSKTESVFEGGLPTMTFRSRDAEYAEHLDSWFFSALSASLLWISTHSKRSISAERGIKPT